MSICKYEQGKIEIDVLPKEIEKLHKNEKKTTMVINVYEQSTIWLNQLNIIDICYVKDIFCYLDAKCDDECIYTKKHCASIQGKNVCIDIIGCNKPVQTTTIY